MVWQILTMWTIVVASIAWFVHDERRLIANATLAQAAFLYGHPARQRQGVDVATEAPGRPVVQRGAEFTSTQRAFLKAFSETT